MVGKEGKDFMESVVYANLGRYSSKVKVGPGVGLDNGVVALSTGKVMILTSDPISVIPSFGMELSAWLSVHLIASDYSASGADPEFAVFSYNFPGPMNSRQRKDYVRWIGLECRRLGIAIVGGHTGSYPGGGFTVIGAGTMMGVAEEGGYVTPAMSRVGDVVMMTKHAGIEATGSLAMAFPEYARKIVGTKMARTAAEEIWLASTVRDSQIARTVGLGPGRVTSMHDATEGGVLGSLAEMSMASGKAIVVDLDVIPVSSEATGVCGAFGLDPLATMGEGALLITCGQAMVPELEKKMARARIPLSAIGRVADGTGLVVHRGRGRKKRYSPAHDRYWDAYRRAARIGPR